MKNITRVTKFLQTQKRLFIILLAALNQAAFAQDNGYWDDRFWPPTYISDIVSSIAVKDSSIFICGANSANMWNGKDWGVSLGRVNRSVIALAIIGNDLYVGGAFITAGGMDFFGLGSIPANNIVKWDLVTKSWSAMESNSHNGVNGTVRTLVARDNKLYVGGQFTLAGGTPANGIAVWSDSTKTWMSLGQGVEGHVRTIALSGKNIYVGGNFTSAGGVPANNIAKWDGRKWVALGGGVNHQVNAIAILNRDVYVGGYFTKAGDVDANAIAKWNIIDKSWSALSSGSKNGVYYYSGIGNVYALAANDHAIFVGGTFNQAGDQSANNIAKWDPVNNTWFPLGSGVQGQVFALIARGNEVYVGGGFTYAGGKRSDRFAIWHEPQASPVLSPLLELRCNEDKILFHPLRHWYSFVTDADDADSTLKFTVLSGKQVKTTRHPRGYSYSAPVNWFGRDTLQVIVTDPNQLADTTSLVIMVDPINDRPQLTGLPDSLSFKTGASTQLKMWDLVEDVETPDSLLLYRFSASNPGLRWKFHRATGMLVLTAPQFHGNVCLFVKAGDGKAAAYDTIAVRVEIPSDILAATEDQNSTEQIPTEFVLQQNYPNPFNPTTLIRFGLPHEAAVRLEILNLSGQHVAMLMNEHKPAGYHEMLWDAGGLSNGVYFYRLTAGNFVAMKKLMLMR